MKVYTFDVGYEVEHVTIQIIANNQEQAEVALTRLMPRQVVEGEMVDFWVNAVEKEDQ